MNQRLTLSTGRPITQLTATGRASIEDHYKTRFENRLKVILYNTKSAYFKHRGILLILGRINATERDGRGTGRQPFFAFVSRGSNRGKGTLDTLSFAAEDSPVAVKIHKLCGAIGISI